MNVLVVITNIAYLLFGLVVLLLRRLDDLGHRLLQLDDLLVLLAANTRLRRVFVSVSLIEFQAQQRNNFVQ